MLKTQRVEEKQNSDKAVTQLIKESISHFLRLSKRYPERVRMLP
jgi:hypothetical protein